MKVQASVKKICSSCIIVVRRKRGNSNGKPGRRPTRIVKCKNNPRHKQRQG